VHLKPSGLPGITPEAVTEDRTGNKTAGTIQSRVLICTNPSGVDTVRAIVPVAEADKTSFSIPVAKREFIGVTGNSKQGTLADVDFTWKCVPPNEIGAALYSGDLRYTSTVGFRDYDDGWCLVQSAPHSGQTLDDAFKNAEPAP
jgi:hypothetical protein